VLSSVITSVTVELLNLEASKEDTSTDQPFVVKNEEGKEIDGKCGKLRSEAGKF
jgi:hypothetical protein